MDSNLESIEFPPTVLCFNIIQTFLQPYLKELTVCHSNFAMIYIAPLNAAYRNPSF